MQEERVLCRRRVAPRWSASSGGVENVSGGGSPPGQRIERYVGRPTTPTPPRLRPETPTTGAEASVICAEAYAYHRTDADADTAHRPSSCKHVCCKCPLEKVVKMQVEKRFKVDESQQDLLLVGKGGLGTTHWYFINTIEFGVPSASADIRCCSTI
ncbi:hypothetical protein Pelo_18060 [Pelomyxa schiedti]|nr:hypothetical protein Pelo_18060 [Pelomyxa schiedti]